MRNLTQILNQVQIEKGDYSRIANIFNMRQADSGTVSRTYVRSVVHGFVPRKGEKAREIMLIASKYFKNKYELERELIAA